MTQLGALWCCRYNQALAKVTHSAWLLRLVMIVSGGLYPLAFAPFSFWPAAIIALLPLLALMGQRQVISAFQIGYCWGLGAFGVGVSWVYVSIHEFGSVPIIGAAAMTLLFVCLLALYKGLFAYLVEKAQSYCGSRAILVSVPLAWLIAEFLQSWLLSGFPWLLLGYTQIDGPLAQWATWFGVYGLGFIVCLITVSVYQWVKQRNRRINRFFLVFSLGLIGIVQMPFWPADKLAQRQLDIALIQPNVAQQEKWDRRYFMSIVNDLFAVTADHWDAELIIWPEGAIPAYAHQVEDILFDAEQLTSPYQSHLVLGIAEYNRANSQSYVALKSVGASPQNYHKQVLVPFGEYVPLQHWLRGLITFFDLPMSGFTPGSSQQQPMTIQGVSIIPAICYEIAYPNIIHRLASQAKNQPKLIVTVSNDAWFGDSFGPYQHMQMARMRALELGVPLARATNDGITAIVDARGQFVAKLDRYEKAALRHSMRLDERPTPYRQWGMSSLLLIVFISILALLWFNRAKHDTKD